MEEILRVLILEDRSIDADLMEYEMQEAGLAYISKRVKTEQEYLYELQEFSPALILSDYNLPQYNGLLALTEAKARCPEVPFILVTGAIGEDRAIDILTSGAKDYVMKNCLHRLVPAIRRALAEAAEIAARKKVEEKLLQTHKYLEMEVETRTAELRREIEERKQIEEALRESGEKFKCIYDNASDGILIASLPEKKFMEANKAICAMLGYTREEIMALGVEAIHPAEDLPQVFETFEKQMRGEKAIAESSPVKRKDGSIFYADICASSITIGEKKSALGIFRDITDRLRAEKALRRSEEFVRTMLDTVDEGFIVIDKDFRILSCNKAFCREAGNQREEIIGSHCYEVSHRIARPCYEEGEECPVRRAFETGMPHAALHRHENAKEEIMHVEVKAFPIRDDYGNVTSVIETINNITEKHLLEEERLKAEKMAAIGTLAGGIAHDFNNLLQGVFGYISVAKMTLDQKERSLAMLAQAEKALQLSVNLTNQLLTFSKGGKPVKKKTDLRPMIDNAVKFALSGSNVDYRINCAEDLRMVEADEGQISQVIQNLALNADQAMPLGGAITITARNVQVSKKGPPPALREGSYVEIVVQDSGSGIPQQFLRKIFDPYFTTKEKGSGLGLATSYSIIRNHGGVIDVSSEIGKGSRFTLYLPVAEGEMITTEAWDGKGAVQKGKVLVMDDEELIRDVAGELIMALGHEVEVAANGEAAIDIYNRARAGGRPFDLVILDLTIRGGLGGIETKERLLAIDPEIKLVVSSGYSDNSMLSDHRMHGFRQCLRKPYRLEELRGVLDSLLA